MGVDTEFVYRASTVATLLAMNEQLYELDPDSAFMRRDIENDRADLDWLRDEISSRLTQLQTAYSAELAQAEVEARKLSAKRLTQECSRNGKTEYLVETNSQMETRLLEDPNSTTIRYADIVYSEEEARKLIAREDARLLAEAKSAVIEQAKADKRAVIDAAKTADYNNVHGFTDNMSKLQAAKALKFLNKAKPNGFHGKPITIKDFINNVVDNGAYINKSCDFSSQNDQKEESLYWSDGGNDYVSYTKTIGKTGLDYAKFLIRLRQV